MGFFEFITNTDFQILNFIQEHIRNAFLDPVMAVLGYLGEAGAVWIILGIVLLFFRKTRPAGVCILAAMALVKPLNALLLGEQYAENLGFNTQRVRNQLLFVTGLLTAVTTAYCGPVVFIGLAVPHVARLLLGTDNHHYLMPATILTGAAVALLCNIICVSPGAKGVIPLNAVTPVMGAPVIIYVILQQKRVS